MSSKVSYSNRQDQARLFAVDVAKRTEPGMCAPGGVARISKVSVSRTGDELCDASYVHSRAKEYSLPVSLVKEVIQCAGRPRRSLEAAITGYRLIREYFLRNFCF